MIGFTDVIQGNERGLPEPAGLEVGYSLVNGVSIPRKSRGFKL